MKVLLLEHKKRNKSAIPEHPDVRIISNNKRLDTIYRIVSKKNGREIGMLRGSRHETNPSVFYVDFMGAHAAGDVKSDKAEKARLKGHRYFKRSVISHLAKHVRKDFPNITKVQARRVSGANPERKIDLAVAKPSPKQVIAQNRLTKGHTREYFPRGVSRGHSVIPTTVRHPDRLDYSKELKNDTGYLIHSATYHQGKYTTMPPPHHHRIGILKSLARAARKIPGVKKLTVQRHGDIVLHKPKKSTYVIKHNGDIEHTRRGSMGYVDISKPRSGLKVSYYPGDRKGHAPKFGELRRIYRVVRTRIKKEHPDAKAYERTVGEYGNSKKLKLRHP